MKRRQFQHCLGALLGATSLRAWAQSSDKPTVGVLVPSTEEAARPHVAALRKGLAENALVDGSSIRLVIRYANNNFEQVPDLVRAFRAEGSRLLVTAGTTAVSATQRAAPDLPIVMAGSADPVTMGFARSLGRPGGRITGLSVLGEELVGKQFQLLKEILPSAASFTSFLQTANPGNGAFRRANDNIGKSLGIQIHTRDINSADEFPAAFEWAIQHSSGAHVNGDPLFDTDRVAIFRAALERRVPTVCGWTSWVQAGAMIACALDIVDMWRQSARYVAQILRGIDPGTIPIEQPTAVQVAVNMRTARALGLTIPPLILARADEVIE